LITPALVAYGERAIDANSQMMNATINTAPKIVAREIVFMLG
jgi:hypothetical protein